MAIGDFDEMEKLSGEAVASADQEHEPLDAERFTAYSSHRLRLQGHPNVDLPG